MVEQDPTAEQVDHFILEQVDSVPHLEALLLAWRHRPKAWTISEMASALYVPAELAEKILRELGQRNLLLELPQTPQRFEYRSNSPQQDDLIARVDQTYRRELIRITRMIHSKVPTSLREFARAFRFSQEKD